MDHSSAFSMAVGIVAFGALVHSVCVGNELTTLQRDIISSDVLTLSPTKSVTEYIPRLRNIRLDDTNTQIIIDVYYHDGADATTYYLPDIGSLKQFKEDQMRRYKASCENAESHVDWSKFSEWYNMQTNSGYPTGAVSKSTHRDGSREITIEHDR